MTSFMISSVPPPMRCSRASRNARAHRRLLEVAGAAEHLQARVDEAVLHLRAVLLRHRDLGDRILVVHDAPRGRVEQRARRLELGRGVGELVRDHLVLGDRTAERRALARVRDRLVEHLRGVTDARRRAREPLVLELPHQLREALARFERR